MSTPWLDTNDIPPPSPPEPPAEATLLATPPIFPYTIPVLWLTIMWFCVAAGGVTAGMAAWTDWQPAWLLPLLLLTFILGFYRRVWLHDRLRVQDRNYGGAVTLAGFVVVVVVARLVAYLSDTTEFAADFADVPANPIKLLYGQFLLYLVTMLIAGYLGREGARNIGQLYIRPYELQANGQGRDAMLFDADRRDAYKGVNSAWQWGGGVMGGFVIAGLFYRNQTENVGPLDLRSQMLSLATVYFVVGLLWNAWGRMRYLRTSWQSRKLPEPPQLMWRWSRYLLVLLLIAAIPAVLIPGGYSLNPFVWLDWLLGLFKTRTQGRPSTGRPPPLVNGTEQPLPTPAPPAPPAPPPLVDLSWLPLALFWLVTVLLLIYALRVLAQTGLGRFRFPDFFLTRWLIAGWNFVLSFVRVRLRFNRQVEETGETRINADERGGLLSFLRPERAPASPRARVRYYYKKLLRKGAKNGLARRRGMAAEEYASYLQQAVANPAEATPDLTDLTSRFQEARYSPHPVSEAAAQQAEQSWQRLEPNIRLPEPPELEATSKEQKERSSNIL